MVAPRLRLGSTDWNWEKTERVGVLEGLGESRLSQDGIGRVAGEDLAINRKPALADGAIPDLVVAFALALEMTPAGPENPFDLRCIVCHQAATRTVARSSR